MVVHHLRRFSPLRVPSLTIPIVLAVAALMIQVPTGSLPREDSSLRGTVDRLGATGGTVGPPGISPAFHVFPSYRTWVNVTNPGPGAAPPRSEGGSSAYDIADHETVYFGGCIEGGDCPSNQTWVFAKGAWTNETNPHDSPPARWGASMDYDVNMQGVLLYGGDGVTGYLSDTWLFRDGRWTNLTYVGPAPPVRYGASLSFDPQPEENGSVLFGGYNSAEGYLNDTWSWEGWRGWVRLSPSIAPIAVAFAAMAYDAANGYVVLFGGYSASGAVGGTWELYSGQWWAISPSPSPPPGDFGGMAYDPSLSGVILFGGLTGSDTSANDTWTFANGAWAENTPLTTPPPLNSFAMALDGTGLTPIVVGGEESFGQDFDSTWAYEFALYVALVSEPTSAEVSENVSFTAYASGGTPPYTAMFNFGDGTHAIVSGPGPEISVVHAFDRTGTFSASVNVTDQVGARYSSVPVSVAVSAGPAIAVKAVSLDGDVGIPLSFETTVTSPGVPPFRYAWDFGDGTNGTGANASHAYSAPGPYRVDVVATDADNATASASLAVSVASDPKLSLMADPSTPEAGVVTTFFANESGGTGPFSYSWRFGDGSGSGFPVPQHSFSSGGTYLIQVWVNDSAGASTYQNLTVSVGPVPSAAADLGNAPLWFWAAVGALAAAAVVGVVVLVRRNRDPRT